jgi:HEAT repeat protein
MMRWLLAPLVGGLIVSLALAEPPRPPEPLYDDIELSIWVRNLGAKKKPVRDRAYAAILALGPAAKPELPRIVETLKQTRGDLNNLPIIELVLRVDPSQAGPHVREMLQQFNRHGRIPPSFIKEHAPDLLPHVLAAIKEGELTQRIEAIHTLSDFGDLAKEALPCLVETAKSAPSPVLRQEALTAIGRLDRKRYADVVPAIIEAVKEGSSDSSIGVDLLRPYADRAISLLVQQLEDQSASGRLEIAAALMDFDGAGRNHVIRNLTNESPSIRLACASAIRNHSERVAAALPPLLMILDDDVPTVRLAAAQAVLAIDSKREAFVLPTLIDLMSAPDPEVRSQAVRRIGSMTVDTRPAVLALLERLDDKDRTVRLRAAEALMRIDPQFGPMIVPALVRSFKEGGWGGRRDNDIRTVTTLAGEVGPAALPTLPYLLKLMEHDNRYGKLIFAVAATRISTAVVDQTVPVLIEFLSDRYEGTGQQVEALRTLGRIGPFARLAIPVVSVVMANDDSSNRFDAAEALIRIAPDDCAKAMTMLRAGLKKRSDRDEALAAIRRLGPLAKDVVPALQALLTSDDRHEREAAESALRLITTTK